MMLNPSFLVFLLCDGPAGVCWHQRGEGSRTIQGGLPGTDSQGWGTLQTTDSPALSPQHSEPSMTRGWAELWGTSRLLPHTALTEKSTDPDEPAGAEALLESVAGGGTSIPTSSRGRQGRQLAGAGELGPGHLPKARDPTRIFPKRPSPSLLICFQWGRRACASRARDLGPTLHHPGARGRKALADPSKARTQPPPNLPSQAGSPVVVSAHPAPLGSFKPGWR